MNGMNSLNRQTGRWAGRYRAGGQAGRQTHSQLLIRFTHIQLVPLKTNATGKLCILTRMGGYAYLSIIMCLPMIDIL